MDNVPSFRINITDILSAGDGHSTADLGVEARGGAGEIAKPPLVIGAVAVRAMTPARQRWARLRVFLRTWFVMRGIYATVTKRNSLLAGTTARNVVAPGSLGASFGIRRMSDQVLSTLSGGKWHRDATPSSEQNAQGVVGSGRSTSAAKQRAKSSGEKSRQTVSHHILRSFTPAACAGAGNG